MLGKGIYTFEVDGKTIGFKFGMLASAYSEKEAGASISVIFEKITNQGGEATLSLLHYFYGAAVAWAKSVKQEPPTIDQVSDYIDSIGVQKAIELFQDSIGAPKNGTPKKKSPLKSQEITE